MDSRPGYRNGYGKERNLTLSCGTITLRRPRVRGIAEKFVGVQFRDGIEVPVEDQVVGRCLITPIDGTSFDFPLDAPEKSTVRGRLITMKCIPGGKQSL